MDSCSVGILGTVLCQLCGEQGCDGHLFWECLSLFTPARFLNVSDLWVGMRAFGLFVFFGMVGLSGSPVGSPCVSIWVGFVLALLSLHRFRWVFRFALHGFYRMCRRLPWQLGFIRQHVLHQFFSVRHLLPHQLWSFRQLSVPKLLPVRHAPSLPRLAPSPVAHRLNASHWPDPSDFLVGQLLHPLPRPRRSLSTNKCVLQCCAQRAGISNAVPGDTVGLRPWNHQDLILCDYLPCLHLACRRPCLPCMVPLPGASSLALVFPSTIPREVTHDSIAAPSMSFALIQHLLHLLSSVIVVQLAMSTVPTCRCLRFVMAQFYLVE